jgi:hypothetical protein
MTATLPYIILFLIGLFTNIRKIKSGYPTTIFFISIFLTFIIITRLRGFQFDLIVYEKLMQETDWGLYFIREFIFHFILRALYYITNSATITYIIIDVMACYILFAILRNHQVSTSYAIIIFLSVGFMIGFFNIYRQNIATLLFALAISYAKIDKYKRSGIVVFLALFVHNAMLFFLPLYINNWFSGFKAKILCLIALVVILVLIVNDFDRGVVSIGGDNSLKYFVYVSSLVLMISILSWRLKRDFWNPIFIQLLSTVAMLTLSFNSTERLLLSCITFLVIEYVILLNEVSQKIAILNLVFLCIFTVPFVYSGVYENIL